ncbi:MAG: hypothetical protein ABIQ99_08160 [Thermoflexales bacterium]
MQTRVRLVTLLGCFSLMVTACSPFGLDPSSCIQPVGGRPVLPLSSPYFVEEIALSPDGTKLAMSYHSPHIPHFGLFDLSAGRFRDWQLGDIVPFGPAGGGGFFAGLAWSANGDRVYALNDWTIHTLAIDRAAEQVAAPCKFCNGFDISSSGTLAIGGRRGDEPGEEQWVYAFDSVSTPTESWSRRVDEFASLAWSPDGTKLVVADLVEGATGRTENRYRVYEHPSGKELPYSVTVSSAPKPTWYNNEELVITQSSSSKVLRWNPSTGVSTTLFAVGPEFKQRGELSAAFLREGSRWAVLVFDGRSGQTMKLDRACIKP